MPEHSPVPWKAVEQGGRFIEDANGKIVDIYANIANLERVVACVNACKTCPTEQVRRGAMEWTQEFYDR